MRVWVWALVCKVYSKTKETDSTMTILRSISLITQQAKACTRTHTQAQMHYLLLVSIDFKLTNRTRIGRLVCGTCFGLAVCVRCTRVHMLSVYSVHIVRAVFNCRSRLVEPASPIIINNFFGCCCCCLTEWVSICFFSRSSFCSISNRTMPKLIALLHTYSHMSMNMHAKQKQS